MCYPYGAYNNSLINILKKKNCKLGLTTKVDIASLSKENAFTLERLDTNDLPKASDEEANSWTRKVVNQVINGFSGGELLVSVMLNQKL